MKKHRSALLFAVLSFPSLLTAQQTELSVSNWLRLETSAQAATRFTLDADASLLSVLPLEMLGTTAFGSGLPDAIAMLWDPGKMAFRAAYVDPTMPLNEGSVAFGWGMADGTYAFAAGGGVASGEASAAFGTGVATGSRSFACGESWTPGYAAFSAGMWNSAGGDYSAALGVVTEAHGEASFATGVSTIAGAFAATAVGRFNVGSYHFSNDGYPWNDGDKIWIPTDPVFEVGIGEPGSATNGGQDLRVNALTVLKNGDVIIPKRQGDIQMGVFGN